MSAPRNRGCKKKTRREALQEIANTDVAPLRFSLMAKASRESQAKLASPAMLTAVRENRVSDCVAWAEGWELPYAILKSWAHRISSEDLGTAAMLTTCNLEFGDKKQIINDAYRNIMLMSGHIIFMERWIKLFRGMFLGFCFFLIVGAVTLFTGRGEGVRQNKDFLLDFFLDYPIAFGMVVLFFMSVGPYLIRR